MNRFYTNVACAGNHILYRGVEDGRRVKTKIDFAPTLYIPTKEETPFSSLDGIPLAPKTFQSIYDAKNFLSQYEDVSGFKVYGNIQNEYLYIAEQHPEELIQWNQNEVVIAYIDIEVGSEHGFPKVENATEPLTAITVKLSTDPNYYVFGSGKFVTDDSTIVYTDSKDEYDLIHKFLEFWENNCPDVVTGWNIKTFDIPYLVNRITNLLGEKVASRLSPWGKIYHKPDKFYGKDIIAYELVGLSILDYLQLFRKYAANCSQESYKLDYIANVELKEKKVSYDEYDSLHQLYKKNYQKFIEYNIHDVKLVERLNAKGRLIDMALTLAYDNKHNPDDVFQQVRMWDVICFNHLLRKNIMIPPKTHQSKDESFEGAYVKSPQIGLFRWLASFDLNSLYPHLMMQYNLSPEMIVDLPEYTPQMEDLVADYSRDIDALLKKIPDLSFLKEKHLTYTPNGQFFRIDRQGFLPAIMQKMYDDRVIYKKKMLDAERARELEKDPSRRLELDDIISRYRNLQLAKKVGLNSAYGACGCEYFRFYDTRIAEAVTLSGQLSIRWIEKQLSEYLNTVLKTGNKDYVIASDTDSIYLFLEPLISKLCPVLPDTNTVITLMDKICKEKIQPFIDLKYKELSEYVNAFEQKMIMKRESLVDSAIWTAKKRYILNVYDQEGVRYTEPKLKIQGLEAVKSSTPMACRDKIKKSIEIILRGDAEKLYDYIDKFREDFKSLPVEDIAFPRSVNGLTKYKGSKVSTLEGYEADESKGKEGSPMHVKACMLYNFHLRKMGLENTYPIIQEGEKIKFIHLKEPNRFHGPVMAFPTKAPTEFKLTECIDYMKQFDRSYIDALKIVVEAIGWQMERETSLDSLFS